MHTQPRLLPAPMVDVPLCEAVAWIGWFPSDVKATCIDLELSIWKATDHRRFTCQ